MWRATSVIIYQRLPGLFGRNPSCTSLYEFMILWFGEAVEESYEGQRLQTQEASSGKTLSAVLRNKKEQRRLNAKTMDIPYIPKTTTPLLTFHILKTKL